jgi:integrase
MTDQPRAWVRKNYMTKDDRNPKYEVLYVAPDTGKQRTKGGFPSKREANNWRTKFIADAERDEYIPEDRQSITFNNLARQYLRNRHFERAHTKNDPTRHLTSKGSLVHKAFADTKLSDMTHERLAAFFADLSAKRVPSTVRHYYYALKLVLDYAVRTKRLNASPLTGIAPPSDKRPARHEAERYPLQPDEIKRIGDTLPPPYDMFARLAAATGARPEELSALTLADVTDVGAIRVTKVLIEVNGKLIHEPYTKAEASYRAITLDSVALRQLRVYITEHQARALKFFSDHSDLTHPGDDLPLFVGLRVGGNHAPDIDRLDFSKPFRYGAFTKRHWRAAVEAAGLPPVNFYALRHVHASLLMDRVGQPGALTIKEIQHRLGHKNANMLLERSYHAGRQDHDQTRTALDAALAPTQPANVVPIKRDA